MEIILNDGTRLVGDAPRSSGPGVTNTYTREWVIEKAVMLMTPVLGKAATDQLVNRCLNLEDLRNILELRRFLQLKIRTGSGAKAVGVAHRHGEPLGRHEHLYERRRSSGIDSSSLTVDVRRSAVSASSGRAAKAAQSAVFARIPAVSSDFADGPSNSPLAPRASVRRGSE